MKTVSNPKKFTPLFKVKVKKLTAIMNPYADQGFLIMGTNYARILNDLDGSTTLKDLQKKYLIKDIKPIIRVLERYRLVAPNNKDINTVNQDYSRKRMGKKLTVWFALTNQCNFRCSYCFVTKTTQTMKSDLIPIALKKIFQTAKHHDVRTVNLVLSGGEPLLAFDKIKIVDEFVKKLGTKYGVSVQLGLISNGYFLTEAVCRYFKDHHISVGISIDGLHQDHDVTRKTKTAKGTYAQVLRGLTLAKKYGILSNISVTCTSKNIKKLPTFVAYILKKIPTKITFSLFKGNPQADTKLYASTPALKKSFQKIFKMLYDATGENKFESPFKEKVIFDGLQLDPPFPSTHYCDAGYYFITVNPDGTVLACPSGTDTVGSLFDSQDLLTSVWNNSGAEYAAESPAILLSKKCSRCLWRYLCAGGCPTERKYVDPSLQKQSTYCPFYKTIIPYILRLEAKRLVNKHLYAQLQNGV